MPQKKQRITLKDIANECGYSVNTVSRALRNDTRLPAGTLSKIQEAADRLGYVRNALASSLRSGKSHIIAAIVDNIQNPYYSSIVSHLDLRLREAGYSLMILSSQVSQKLAGKQVSNTLGQEMINVAISHRVDGIVFFPYTTFSELAQHIEENHIPFVQIGREICGLEADVVRCDDYAGGRLAGNELVKLGHRRFLYIAGEPFISSQTDRQKGFIDAVTESGIPAQNIRIVSPGDMMRAMQENSVMKLLTPIDYTAVFSFNDYMAYPVIHHLQEAGFCIPEDISIIGFDNLNQYIPYASPLSSIANPPDFSFSDIVTDLLLSRIEDPSLPARPRISPVMLYDHKTHGPCKKPR